jgi:hypothetical protein
MKKFENTTIEADEVGLGKVKVFNWGSVEKDKKGLIIESQLGKMRVWNATTGTVAVRVNGPWVKKLNKENA